jgi:hypothetical protein
MCLSLENNKLHTKYHVFYIFEKGENLKASFNLFRIFILKSTLKNRQRALIFPSLYQNKEAAGGKQDLYRLNTNAIKTPRISDFSNIRGASF